MSRASLVHATRVAGVALLVAACGARKDPERQQIATKDDGLVCLGALEADAGEDRTATMEINEPLRVDVRSRGCLALDCVTERHAKCVVDQSGDRLVVRSELSWIAPTEISSRTCAVECAPLDAHCESKPLPRGHYTVVLGKEEMGIDIPSTLEWACLNPRVPYGPRPEQRKLIPPPAPDAGAAGGDGGAAGAIASGDGDGGGGAVASAPTSTSMFASQPPPPPRHASVCVGPAGKKAGIQKNQALRVRVEEPNPCNNFSCSFAPKGEQKCTTKRQGQRIVVTSSTKTAGKHVACTDECPPIVASCKTDPLPAGEYQLLIGDDRRVVQVPSPTLAPCP